MVTRWDHRGSVVRPHSIHHYTADINITKVRMFPTPDRAGQADFGEGGGGGYALEDMADKGLVGGGRGIRM